MLEMCDFRSHLLSKHTQRLRAPLVGTMIDPPTVRLGDANVDHRCLVVTQTHSVLSAFSLSLLFQAVDSLVHLVELVVIL